MSSGNSHRINIFTSIYVEGEDYTICDYWPVELNLCSFLYSNDFIALLPCEIVVKETTSMWNCSEEAEKGDEAQTHSCPLKSPAVKTAC